MDLATDLYILRLRDGKRVILPTYLEGIVGLTDFMQSVLYSKEKYYEEKKSSLGKVVQLVSKLGKHLYRLQQYAGVFSKEYRFSPMLEFFFTEYRTHPIREHTCPIDRYDRTGTKLFDEFVEGLRKKSVNQNLKKRIADWNSKYDKNWESLQAFEAKLFKRHARVLAIRLDFLYHAAVISPDEIDAVAYKEALRNMQSQRDYMNGEDISERSEVVGRVALEEVQVDRARLFANLKSKTSLFEHLVGYAWRIEFGKEAGYHLHVVFFFDGSRVQHHEHLAHLIGQYWAEDITEGRGYFYNCNLNKARYGEAWALGLIDHWDGEKRKKLREKVLAYFCKNSQVVPAVRMSGSRLMATGLIRRRPKAPGGRPRTKRSGNADEAV